MEIHIHIHIRITYIHSIEKKLFALVLVRTFGISIEYVPLRAYHVN